MAKQASLTMCDDEVEFVQSADGQEEQEETTENMQMEPSTQYVLEVEPVEEPKKKNKGKGKSSSLAATKKRIMSHPFIKWLKTIWIADTTLRVMKPWLKAINEESLKTKNQTMFLLGQTISQIMKQFFIHMKDNEKSLIDCSFANFEEWCCGEGLSMMSGRLPEMVWKDDSRDIVQPLQRLHYGTSSSSRRYSIGQRPGTGSSSNEAQNNIQGIFIIAEHEKHLHVIHDCAYSGSTCRCLHIQRLREYIVTDDEPEEGSRWSSTQERYVDEGELTLKEQEGSNIRERKRRRSLSPGTTIHRQTSKQKRRRDVRTGIDGITYKKSKETEQTSSRHEQRVGCSTGRRGLHLYGRFTRPSSFIDAEHWKNIAEYFNKGRRRIYLFYIAGRTWVHDFEVRNVSLQRLFASGNESILDEENLQQSCGGLLQEFSCIQDGDETPGTIDSTGGRSQGSKNREKSTNRLETFLESFVITPTKNILYTGHWTNGPFKYMPKNKAILQTCFHNVNQKIVDMTYREIFLRTRKISMNKLIYVADWNNVGESY